MPSKVQFSDGFKRAFRMTYQAIGHDIEQVFAENPKDYKRADRDAIMAESVLDANRMQMYGGTDGQAADEECDSLIKKHGYPAVLKAAKELL